MTQSIVLSLLPSSAYPGHARMFTSPSIAPSDFFMGTSGAVNVPAPVLPESPESSEPPLEVPQAAAPKASTSDTAIVVVFFMESPR